jgi:phospholipase/carboxylesterase
MVSRYIEVGEDRAPLSFRLRTPEDENAAPIVMLHGLGGDEKVMWGLESALPQTGMVVTPSAHHAQPQGGYAWNRIIDAWPPLISEFSEAVDLLEELLDYLQAEYTFQRERMILMGFSNGAAMSFAASMTPMSQAPAGIIAIAGHLPEGDLSPLRGIPVYWGHGMRDSFIPIDIARADAERLREAGVPVTLCEADVGHKLGAECLKNLGVWFAAKFSTQETQDELTE